jgi:O-methyltransferase
MGTGTKLYLELLKKTLTDTLRCSDEYAKHEGPKGIRFTIVEKYLLKRGYDIMKRIPFNLEKRKIGRDWPMHAETMVGVERLNNIEKLLTDIIEHSIEGDCIETGVWRGGATIFMAAIIKAYEQTNRNVWVADSFEGLPKPNAEKYPHDKGDVHHTKTRLAISKEDVEQNFRNYNLLGDNIKFLKGWFKDTLPNAPIEKLALVRLDGDMYESTMDGLVNLYPKLQSGGYIIIDDWGAVPACKKAVLDYREQYGITEDIILIDWGGVYWKKK